MNQASQLIQSIIEADAADDVSAKISDSSAKIAKELALLKELTATGQDNKELQSAVKYIEGAIILLNQVTSRNIQQ